MSILRCESARHLAPQSSQRLRHVLPPSFQPVALAHRGCARWHVFASASHVDAGQHRMLEDMDDRVSYIADRSQLKYELDVAGKRLVVLELMADNECETGLFEPEPEDHWTPRSEQHKKKMEVCSGISHEYMKMAADSPDSRFLASMEDEENPSEVAKSLGISVFPAVVFFKDGKVVWQRQGSEGMPGDMAEGLLYFGGARMDRKESVTSVTDLHSEKDVEEFIVAETDAKVKIIMVSTDLCSPCVHVYPSYVTLAMNFRDLIDFGRVDAEDDAMASLCKTLNIREVPTFIAYSKGKEVDRLISGNRGDLVGHLLGLSMKFGIDPPRPK